MRLTRTCTLVVSVLVLALVAARAQTNVGQLEGVVRDAAGGALPGVTVTVSNPPIERRAVTDLKGAFAVRGLPPGRYAVAATLAGFQPARASMLIEAGATAKVSLSLRVAAAAENVAVSKDAPAPQPAPALPPPPSAMRAYVGGVIGGIAGGLAGAPPWNTEAYDRITDNAWHDVSQAPLSTFSTDVDTASYSNVRRFLNQGQAPPKDAVRIEELINYFPFNYPEPKDGKPFSVTTAIGECPWNSAHKLALIGLQAKRIDATHIPPRNLVFLIDVSGSMMGPLRLPLVKASLAMLAPNLTEKDRVAIVVYAGNTGLVLPSTSGADTPTILDALKRLEAGGSTNGGAGLALAYKVAQEHFITGGVNRVILATDGDFNVGVTDQGSLVRMIEGKRATGVALSVLGYGMGNIKDSTMVKLADAGNGNYAYIDSLSEAQKVLVEQAGGTLVTVAKDVKLQVEFNPRVVGAYRLIGYEKRILQDQDFNNDKKDAGDMGAGHSVTALYELVPAGQKSDDTGVDPLKYQQPGALSTQAQSAEAMTVKLRYKQPDGDVSALMSVAVSPTTGNLPARSPNGSRVTIRTATAASSFA